MIRAAIYARVSTDDQTEHSPAAQVAACEAYAEARGWQISARFIDEGRSGMTDKRPAFQEMIAAARKHEFDVVLIHKLDRFARNRYDAAIYKRLLRDECDVRLIAITQDFELDGPEAVILESSLEAIAHWYSLNLAREVRKSQVPLAQKGHFMARPPHGYRVVYDQPGSDGKPRGRVVQEPHEATMVRLIFDLALEGHGVWRIVQELNSRGLRLQSGGPWTKVRVRYILGNPFYAGIVRWNVREGRQQRKRPAADWIEAPGEHEPIVSRDEFDRVQNILSRHRPPRGRNRGTPIFSGLVICGVCGTSMWASRRRSSSRSRYYAYYRCGRYLSSGSCQSAYISDRALMRAIQSELRGIIGGQVVEMPGPVGAPRADEIQMLDRRLRQIEARFQRQLLAYESGVIDLALLQEAKARLAAEAGPIRSQLEALQSAVEIPASPAAPISAEELLAALESSIPDEEKNRALKSVIDSIRWDGKELVIRWRASF